MKYGSKINPWPVSAGDISNWLYYQQSQDTDYPMSGDELQARLLRQTAATPAMIAGKLFHELIELQMKGGETVIGHYNMTDGHHKVDFVFEPDIELPLTETVEQDVDLTVPTPAGWVNIRCVVDALSGFVVSDYKLTTKPNDMVRRCTESFQWRIYLAALGEQYERFVYHVFACKFPKRLQQKLAATARATIQVVDHFTVETRRYPTMHDDIQNAAGGLAGYLDQIGFQPPAKREMGVF